MRGMRPLKARFTVRVSLQQVAITHETHVHREPHGKAECVLYRHPIFGGVCTFAARVVLTQGHTGGSSAQETFSFRFRLYDPPCTCGTRLGFYGEIRFGNFLSRVDGEVEVCVHTNAFTIHLKDGKFIQRGIRTHSKKMNTAKGRDRLLHVYSF